MHDARGRTDLDRYAMSGWRYPLVMRRRGCTSVITSDEGRGRRERDGESNDVMGWDWAIVATSWGRELERSDKECQKRVISSPTPELALQRGGCAGYDVQLVRLIGAG